MSNASSWRLVAAVGVGVVVLGATAVASIEVGRRIGHRRGVEVARQEVAARLRADVEAASALRIGEASRAALVLESSIDDGVRRLRDDAALAGEREVMLVMTGVAAARLYRGVVASPDPEARADVARLPTPPEGRSPVSLSLAKLLSEDRRPAAPADPALEGETVGRRDGGDDLVVHYTTLRALPDCAGHQAEMKRVWKASVRSHLPDGSIRTVVLFPEDVFGASVSFAFTRTGSTWSARAPCAIQITP